MARKRMLAASFWTDEKIGECNMLERLLFLGLISNADDEGLGRANPKLLMSLIFPYDDIRISDFKKSLDKLSSLGMIRIYTSNGQQYYHVKNFQKHQNINRPTPSDLPKPNGCDVKNDAQTYAKSMESDAKNDNFGTLTDYSLNTHGVLSERSVLREEKRKEDKRREDSIYCTEPENADGVSAPCFMLPLASGDTFPVYERDIEKYASLYPAVDIRQQIRNMIGWLDANPVKRKTKSGIKKFINSWLAKEQNRGGSSMRSGNAVSSDTSERLEFNLDDICEKPKEVLL